MPSVEAPPQTVPINLPKLKKIGEDLEPKIKLPKLKKIEI